MGTDVYDDDDWKSVACARCKLGIVKLWELLSSCSTSRHRIAISCYGTSRSSWLTLLGETTLELIVTILRGGCPA